MDGWADPGFGAVADAFVGNLQRYDLGAAVALYVDGRPVVDLWGGTADARTGRAWSRDTIAIVFSCAKGILALCVAALAEEGLVDLDAPEVRYWPEFGAHGKDRLTVRELLSHRAGLPAVDRPLTLDDLRAWTPVARALAAQSPLWPPGAAHAYHPLTYGWLVGEVVRRVTGLTPGAYLRTAFAEPLALSTWIGLPSDEVDRLAPLAPHGPDDADPAADAVVLDDMVVRALTMGGALRQWWPGSNIEVFNDPAVLGVEMPAGNVVTTARDLARLYAAAVSDLGGPRRLSPATVTDITVPLSSGAEWPNHDPAADALTWGSGFLLHTRATRLMLGPRSFGHGGISGALGFADDQYRVGFGYVVNRMSDFSEDRAAALVAAVRRCLGVGAAS